MKFWEAMKALEEGKKVRSKDWPPQQWVLKEDMEETFGRSSVDEWELYEEPERTYSFMEVVKAMREGKRFVRSGNASDTALFVMGNEIYPRTKYGIETLKIEDFEALDWIEVR